MSAVFKPVPLKLSPMQEEELPEVMQIEERAYAFPWSIGIMRGCLQQGYCCWLGRVGDEIVGYFILSIAAGEAHVMNICIDPAWQGQGLGRRLMRQLIYIVRNRDVETLFLEVRASNYKAISLYESMGFNEIHVRRGYYPAGKKREDALIFALPFVSMD
ncbi:MAG: ribosomal protein S18-alanine N-acetyltransferase [gamma proteobacterium symbiont of Bathyaustriella thionipta]|nr:ribosomal protein S18-alanine N-acetyltransferase [gamma proteobacterium symbiont of Bathyaustriella thionipta]